MRHIHKKNSIPIGLFTVILLITLFFGLKPEGYRFLNQVKLCPDDSCLAFTNFGMVYSKKTLDEIGISETISIFFSLQPKWPGNQLRRIISIITPQGAEKVSVSQWRDGIEVTLRDELGKEFIKMGKKDAFSYNSVRALAITISNKNIQIVTDNKTEFIKQQSLSLPPRYFKDCQISLGLAPNGRNPWRGKMTHIALYKKYLDPKTLSVCFQKFKTNGILPDIPKIQPVVEFNFIEPSGNVIYNQSNNYWNLTIPFFPKIFKHNAFNLFPDFHFIDKSFISDILINFFGFIPFGSSCFLLFQFWCSNKKSILLALLIGVCLSFSIEVGQIFIPTRDSQVTDVFFNGLGTLIGAWGIGVFIKQLHLSQ